MYLIYFSVVDLHITMSKNQAVDRSVGLVVTIVGALAIAYTVTLIRQHLQHDHKPDSDHPDSNQTNSDHTKAAGNTNTQLVKTC